MDAVEQYRQRRKNRLHKRMMETDNAAERAKLAKILYKTCYLPFRKPKPTDKTPQSCYNKNIPNNLFQSLHSVSRDVANEDDWITVNGQHIEVNEGGKVVNGNPKIFGESSGGRSEKSSANTGDYGNREIPKDSNGKSYSRPAVKLDKAEYRQVMEEIDSAYDSLYSGMKYGVHTTYSESAKEYVDLRFEIHGKNEYNFYKREINTD